MKKHRLLIALTLVLFAIATYALGWSNLFTVSSIEIKGTKVHLSSTIKPGEKLARVETHAVAKEFEVHDWIKHAEVSRNWFNGKITITITERTPIAIYNNRAIDSDGASFIITSQNIQGLPRIQAPTIALAVTAAAFYSSLPHGIAGSVQLVKVRAGDLYTLEMKAKAKIIEVSWGTNTENLLKAKVYSALIARPENSTVRRIDLTAPHAPIVK